MRHRDRHKQTLASSKRRLRHVHRISFANVVSSRRNDLQKTPHTSTSTAHIDSPPQPPYHFTSNHHSQFRISQKGFLPFTTTKTATSTNVSITTKGEENDSQFITTDTCVHDDSGKLTPEPTIASIAETPTHSTPETEISRVASSESLTDELIEFHPPTAFFSLHDPDNPEEPIYVSPLFVCESTFGMDMEFDKDYRDLKKLLVLLWLQDREDKELFKPVVNRVDFSCLRYIGQDEVSAHGPNQLVLSLDDGCFIPGLHASPIKTATTAPSSGIRTPAEPLNAAPLDQMLKVLNMEHLVKDAERTRQAISEEVDTLTRNRKLLTMAEWSENCIMAEIARIRAAQAEVATEIFKLNQKKTKLIRDIEIRKAYLQSGGLLQDKAKIALHETPSTDVREKVEEEKRALAEIRKVSLRQLHEIYPITHSNGEYIIAGLSLTSENEHEQTFAYSLTCELLMLLSGLLEIPLKYPITRLGAHHAIFDPVSVITGSRAFPLFPSSLLYRFEYAVLLLNKDIQMILELLKIPIVDGRETLGMLANLLAVHI